MDEMCKTRMRQKEAKQRLAREHHENVENEIALIFKRMPWQSESKKAKPGT